MSDRLRLAAYIPELDGLRGLAIGSVLLYHCHEKLRSSHLDVITQWGWVGVNLFFVLSGFLITGIILDARDDPNFFGISMPVGDCASGQSMYLCSC